VQASQWSGLKDSPKAQAGTSAMQNAVHDHCIGNTCGKENLPEQSNGRNFLTVCQSVSLNSFVTCVVNDMALTTM